MKPFLHWKSPTDEGLSCFNETHKKGSFYDTAKINIVKFLLLFQVWLNFLNESKFLAG